LAARCGGRRLGPAAVLLASAHALFGASAAPAPAAIDFNRDVRPIFAANCYKCHGPDEEERKARLRFDLRFEALKPAKSGNPAIVPGSPEKSEMVARITAEDPDDRMPPVRTGKELSAAQIELLRKWIAQGAPYATHWAYVKPVRPALPAVRRGEWALNAIDRFILARLEQEGLSPSAPADRATLVRRVSLDLTGLPPAPEEVDRFIVDRDPRAYEDLVDRLLNRPAFGEHWARMWLDLARYADSAGYADDPPRTIWAYRDYVIRAFNANKPFDRFTLEQIAGDLLDDAGEEGTVASAFHRNTMTNNEGGTIDEEFRNAAIVDRVNTTMAVWMATSMGCAQCHSHKYDPISQREYFRFFAFFNNTEDANRHDEAPAFELYSAEQKENRRQWRADVDRVEAIFKTPTAESAAGLAKWEEAFPRQHPWHAFAPAAAKTRDGGSLQPAGARALGIAPRQTNELYSAEFSLDLDHIAGLRIEVSPSAAGPGDRPQIDRGFRITHVTAAVSAPATNRLHGRYVRVEIPGKEKILSLAEVQIFRGDTNLAPSGVASQSSVAYDAPARLAIDSNTDGNFDRGKSTTHTETSENPWWEVDLKALEAIDRIVIWNRTDEGVRSRLSDFRVALLDEARHPVWERAVADPPNPSTTFSLNGSGPIEFATAFGDVTRPGSEPGEVIAGGRGKQGWAVVPDQSGPHFLTLLAAKPFPVPPGSKLEVAFELGCQLGASPAAVVRIAASDDPRICAYARLPAVVLEILAVAPLERGGPRQSALSEYYRANIAPELQPERDLLKRLKKDLAEPPPTTVPVMRELAGAKRRATHLEFRGNYLALGDEVTEGVPAAFHPLPTGAPLNRLTLARWLVDPDNPLTARCLANRFWEQIFGVGIVRTSEDFGTQGDRPTHPELLDWLATELIARHWNIKEFLKLLVTSATYRQSSRVTPALWERDPDNLLLARGPRFRASAEIVRDQALAVSGLLSPKMYGPPVRPPQPSLGLSAAFGGSLDWKTSEGEDRYRRALYVEWRRTSPYPSLATFDAPTREVCALRRSRSNTPLQALVTLNDPVYVEAARALGRRMAKADGTVSDHARFGFRLCLARPPYAHELDRLVDFYQAARADYENHPEAAQALASPAAGSAPQVEDAAELAAWTAVGNVLLNLDEMLMKP